MSLRTTTRWLRTFVNAHKLSSFQDKAAALRAEPNPYYVLEWLVLPRIAEDEEEPVWDAWGGERTPGVEKGSLIGVEACFREQLPLELLVGAPIGDEEAAKLATAFADLSVRYGDERWSAGLADLGERLRHAAERYADYVEALKAETERLEREAAEQLAELEAEAAEYEEGEFDLEAEKRAAQAKWDRRKQELPGKVLQRLFPDDALLRLMATANMPRPAERVRGAVRRLAESARHPALRFAEALERGDYEQLRHLAEPSGAQAWGGWLAAYMSRSDLTRSWLPVEDRQRAAIRWIAAAEAEARQEAVGDEAADARPRAAKDGWVASAFRAAGWEERLAEAEFAEEALHRFVWYALPDEELRKRLREELVLKQWSAFVERFAEDGVEERFRALSWVFLLDPENVQHRLLRAAPGGAEELIRRLCRLYAEGVRRGLDVRIVVSVYAYLAKHDKEAFYSFVHGARTLDVALPMMELPASDLSQLFRGDGVRQSSARKHLLQLFYAHLEEAEPKQAPQERMLKLAAILAVDKRSAVVGWLQRHERDWRESIGGDRERLFTRLLRFRWLGTAADPAEQHRAVKEWLQRHSDWVQFETDAPNVEGEGVAYRVVKPGAIDAETGEVLARATVRAEWTDRAEVNKLLDDLKLL
ncbi:hypothetical protein [Paenibacillus sp.]|uniref:hypothetical protein n=1 Tax=Paenibacillus sp. TaxID=58172 RepID=UPI002D487AE7|nr:hypothetical protein [Paenibacillus sp.]HZG88522.1 hypothetical protein [Paenibacillus sp.]